MSHLVEGHKPSSIGFLLLENFSLTCFTQCLDVLVTANLIRPGSVKVHTFSRNDSEVMSDLAIPHQAGYPPDRHQDRRPGSDDCLRGVAHA